MENNISMIDSIKKISMINSILDNIYIRKSLMIEEINVLNIDPSFYRVTIDKINAELQEMDQKAKALEAEKALLTN